MSTTTLPPTTWFATTQPVDNTIAGPLFISGDGFVDQNGDDAFLLGIGIDQYEWSVGGLLCWNVTTKGRVLNTQPVSGYTYQQSLLRHLQNIKAGGFNAVRLLGNTMGLTCWPLDPTGTIATTTRSIDPVVIQALGILFQACEQLDLKICWVSQAARQVVAADDPALPGGTTPEFQEMILPANQPIGTRTPNLLSSTYWAFFKSALGLQIEYDTKFFSTINPSTGVPFGLSPALFLVELNNEDDPCKNLFMPPAATAPIFTAAYTAAEQAYAAANGIIWTSSLSLHKADLQRFMALQARGQLQQRITAIRSVLGPNVYVSAGTWYGNACWPSVVSLSGGDVMTGHCYSYELTGEANNYTALQSNGISHYEAVIKGLNVGKPVIMTEGNAVEQYDGNSTLDSVTNQQAMLESWVTAAINSRASGLFVYSGGLHPFMYPDTATGRKVNNYDTLANQNILPPNTAQIVSRIFKGRSRKYACGPTVVPIPQTYGTPGPAGSAYELTGGYTTTPGQGNNVPGYVQMQLQDVPTAMGTQAA